jgi:hypothetical protein
MRRAPVEPPPGPGPPRPLAKRWEVHCARQLGRPPSTPATPPRRWVVGQLVWSPSAPLRSARLWVADVGCLGRRPSSLPALPRTARLRGVNTGRLVRQPPAPPHPARQWVESEDQWVRHPSVSPVPPHNTRLWVESVGRRVRRPSGPPKALQAAGLLRAPQGLPPNPAWVGGSCQG